MIESGSSEFQRQRAAPAPKCGEMGKHPSQQDTVLPWYNVAATCVRPAEGSHPGPILSRPTFRDPPFFNCKTKKTMFKKLALCNNTPIHVQGLRGTKNLHPFLHTFVLAPKSHHRCDTAGSKFCSPEDSLAWFDPECNKKEMNFDGGCACSSTYSQETRSDSTNGDCARQAVRCNGEAENGGRVASCLSLTHHPFQRHAPEYINNVHANCICAADQAGSF